MTKENDHINTMTTTNLSVVGSGPMWAPVENEDITNKMNFSFRERERERERENNLPG